MQNNKTVYFIAAIFGVIIVWLLYPIALLLALKCGLIDKSTWESAGVFGDAFGALNTLFSGLALAGLAINIFIQNRQLRELERKEAMTSHQLRMQTKMSVLTALLTTYQAEAETYERIALSIKGDQEFDNISRLTAIQNRDQVLKKRNIFLREVESILDSANTPINDNESNASAT
ncbi:MAG: hypothetical protein K2Q15_16240 [Burkholderiales bacterium]|nr:hypothetical protein [Burkholderiales bacterium]